MVTKNKNNTFNNEVKSIISKVNFIYYRKLYDRNRQNTAKTWSVIRSIISTNTRSTARVNNGAFYKLSKSETGFHT